MLTTQATRLESMMNDYAGESVAVEKINATVYVYGSELACHRIFYKYRLSADKARVGFSDNLQTWFFALDI